jgi:allantoicase
MFFGSKENLIAPWPAESMRDGWETRRRRGPGHDWAIVRLGRPGVIARLEVDTKHFKGNYPDRCSVEVCDSKDAAVDVLNWGTFEWRTLLPVTPLSAHTNHGFEPELADAGACSHVRLSIYPDGGVSRLRAFVAAE